MAAVIRQAYHGGMSKPAQTRREQLIEARDTLRRQIEILGSPVGCYGKPDNVSLIAELNEELGEIEDELAAEESGQPQD